MSNLQILFNGSTKKLNYCFENQEHIVNVFTDLITRIAIDLSLKGYKSSIQESEIKILLDERKDILNNIRSSIKSQGEVTDMFLFYFWGRFIN